MALDADEPHGTDPCADDLRSSGGRTTHVLLKPFSGMYFDSHICVFICTSTVCPVSVSLGAPEMEPSIESIIVVFLTWPYPGLST